MIVDPSGDFAVNRAEFGLYDIVVSTYAEVFSLGTVFKHKGADKMIVVCLDENEQIIPMEVNFGKATIRRHARH